MTNRKAEVFDFEGIGVTPAIDYAWDGYEILIPDSSPIKILFPRTRIQRFDEYDDVRWAREDRVRGHSTGTTPNVMDCVLACAGIGDDILIPFSKDVLGREKPGVYKPGAINPGFIELLNHLKDKGIEIYVISNSFAGPPLIFAYDFGIPSSHVYTHGSQLTENELERFDTMRMAAKTDEERESILDEEIRARSQMRVLVEYRDELKDVTDKLLTNCDELLNAYEKRNVTEQRRLKRQQILLIDVVESPELWDELVCTFLDEEAIRGGHRKADAIEYISGTYKVLGYNGDSIVDANPVRYAQQTGSIGRTTNCRDKYALRASGINAATDDFSLWIPVYDAEHNGHGIRDAKKHARDNFVIFSPDDIKANIDRVRGVNGEFKNKLREPYKPIREALVAKYAA